MSAGKRGVLYLSFLRFLIASFRSGIGKHRINLSAQPAANLSVLLGQRTDTCGDQPAGIHSGPVSVRFHR
jgi:hypothetical protein